MINTRAPNGANNDTIQHKSPQMITKEASDWMGIMFYGDDRAQKC